MTVILLAFISCTNDYKTTTTYKKLDRMDIVNVKGRTNIVIYEIEYKGHEYLIFEGYEAMGVEHSPDCKKCKSKSEYTPTEYLY